MGDTIVFMVGKTPRCVIRMLEQLMQGHGWFSMCFPMATMWSFKADSGLRRLGFKPRLQVVQIVVRIGLRLRDRQVDSGRRGPFHHCLH